MKKWILLFLLLPNLAWGATYYMQHGGTAANKAAATGPCGTASGCMSIATHNGETFATDDVINLCDDGGDFRTTWFVPPSSGTSGHPITYQAASGDTPVVNGSEIITTWTIVESTTVGPFQPGENGDDCRTDGVSGINLGISTFGNSGGADRNYGARFMNVAVAADATITNAYIEFTSTGPSTTDDVKVTIEADTDVTPATFSTYADFAGRSRTTAKVNWTVEHFGIDNTTHNSPDISTIIQEIVNTEGWASGNELAIFLENNASTASAYRTTYDYSVSTTKTAKLYVTYSSAGDNVYSATVATQPKIAFYNGTRLTYNHVGQSVGLNEWDWVDATDTMYVNVGEDPDTGVLEAGQRADGIRIVNKEYITVSGAITVTKANSYGLHAAIAITGLHLNGITASKNADMGVDVDSDTSVVSGIIVENCNFNYNDGKGLHWAGSANTGGIIRNNIAHHNSQNLSTELVSYLDTTAGIYTICTEGQGPKIYGNTSYSNGIEGATDFQGAGIYDDTCAGTEIYNNLIYDNYGGGLIIEKSVDGIASYNVVLNNQLSSVPVYGNIQVRAGEALNSTGVKLYNNTSVGGKNGIYVFSFTAGTLISNTIVKNNIAINATGYQFYAGLGGNNNTTEGSGNVYTYNCFDTEAATLAFWTGTGARITYDALETSYGSAMNNVEADPAFVSATDFHIPSTSPCKDAGTSVGLTRDYAWVTVPMGAAVDIGAYEYVFPAVRGLTIHGGRLR